MAFGIPTSSESDEPEHTHYRRVLWPFLTPAAVAGYETRIRECVTELINEFIESGQAEIMSQLAKPVPAQITVQFFGFSAEEGRHIYDLLDTALVEGAGGDRERAHGAVSEFFTILQTSLDAARRDPGNDVSSAIVTYDYEGKRFDESECLGVLTTAVAGALATTVGAIGHAVHLLWRYPDQRRRLVERPELVVSAVEEVLRMESPTHTLARTLTESCQVEGVTLAPGERVLLLVDSANYDDGAFEDPEQFQADRPNNSHLAFGYGIHKCEGQHLARLELKVVIEELTRRIPEYEVVGAPTICAQGGVLTPTSLRITFQPGKRVPVS
jgi:cytochrome P450